MNYLAVLVCAILSMVLGSIWHSPLMFGNIWCKIHGMTMDLTKEQMKEIQKKMVPTYITQFVLSLIYIFVLAHFVIPNAIGMSVMIGVWIFIGFIMPTIAGASLWTGKPRKAAWQMFGISAGYSLVLMILVSIILSAWM